MLPCSSRTHAATAPYSAGREGQAACRRHINQELASAQVRKIICRWHLTTVVFNAIHQLGDHNACGLPVGVQRDATSNSACVSAWCAMNTVDGIHVTLSLPSACMQACTDIRLHSYTAVTELAWPWGALQLSCIVGHASSISGWEPDMYNICTRYMPVMV